jgi:hypothetical protein
MVEPEQLERRALERKNRWGQRRHVLEEPRTPSGHELSDTLATDRCLHVLRGMSFVDTTGLCRACYKDVWPCKGPFDYLCRQDLVR